MWSRKFLGFANSESQIKHLLSVCLWLLNVPLLSSRKQIRQMKFFGSHLRNSQLLVCAWSSFLLRKTVTQNLHACLPVSHFLVSMVGFSFFFLFFFKFMSGSSSESGNFSFFPPASSSDDHFPLNVGCGAFIGFLTSGLTSGLYFRSNSESSESDSREDSDDQLSPSKVGAGDGDGDVDFFTAGLVVSGFVESSASSSSTSTFGSNFILSSK